jgi:CDP-4-dehydro-6-deoxyglucose reductase, E1
MAADEHAQALEAQILALTRDYAATVHAARGPGGAGRFVPGETPVPYAGRVFASEEVEALVRSSLEFWLTLGAEGDAFEKELAAQLGVRRSLLTNSGSSANLLAVMALTSPKLPAERRIRPGDEVITCAAGFPTTVAPIVQAGAVPVFIDADIRTGNPDFTHLEAAYRPGVTKALFCAHTLGNPFDLATALAFCQKHDLWLIEDNCDALGSLYSISGDAPRLTGTFGELSTQSFYPPHHLTMGEGGAVNVVQDMRLKVLVESFRDWGRDCWCASGQDNTCGKRFGWQLGELPTGYDHKYIYSHLGYNLKPLDLQAAIGRVQLRRLEEFGRARRRNWQRLRVGLDDLRDFFDFSLPAHAAECVVDSSSSTSTLHFNWDRSGHRSDPSWFGFMLLLKPEGPFTAADLGRRLDEAKIGHRRLFGGNLVRQPAFVQLRRERPEAIRIVGDLPGADRLMNDAMFIGVYPGLSDAMIDYMIEVIHDFYGKRR